MASFATTNVYSENAVEGYLLYPAIGDAALERENILVQMEKVDINAERYAERTRKLKIKLEDKLRDACRKHRKLLGFFKKKLKIIKPAQVVVQSIQPNPMDWEIGVPQADAM